MHIGILTGGGDCPGLNAVIRAVTLALINECGARVTGIERGFLGLVERQVRPLDAAAVSGILAQGGTILGTHNRCDPFHYFGENGADVSLRTVAFARELELDALVVIGGDGTMAIADRLGRLGLPVVGVPKTIDNDIVETTMTFGFDTAVSFATDALDRLHTTAEAHHRVMVVEVMGRYAGWIALYSGIAGGADVILIPEIPYDVNKVVTRIRERDSWGARFSIVVVAEGAHASGGEREVAIAGTPDRVERLGGIGAKISRDIEKLSGKESRHVVLGHLQRGGSPTSYDRVLATRFGAYAVDALLRGESGVMAALKSPDIVSVSIEQIAGRTRTVPVNGDIVRTARHIGISFGD